ncbi:MAG: phosphoribosyltransferase family protein, partial [Fidelibacterota bacterium]
NHSDVYVEKFRILENPEALDRLCQAMAAHFRDSRIELVVGAAIGGILLAGGVGRHLGVRHIFAERVNGKLEFRRGFLVSPGTRVLIVEDIVTTGGSVMELIDLLKENDAEIIGIVEMVDRSKNGISFDPITKTLLKLPSQSWKPENCPLCKQSIPLTSRGRSGK